MRQRKLEYIDSNGDRELWRAEIEQPDGEWVAIYLGKVFINVQGIRKQTPEDPAWNSQAEGLAWLMQG
jgi:hypothetical protein